jgi:hypothetical protein
MLYRLSYVRVWLRITNSPRKLLRAVVARLLGRKG